MKKDIALKVRQALQAQADEATRQGSRRFFKEAIQCHGVKSPAVNRIGKELFQEIRDCGKQEIFSHCEALWQSGYIEETIVAANWAYALRKQYEPADFAVFERWVRQYVGNWASCDTLCNHAVGEFVTRQPEFLTELKRWTGSENRWVRRAAAVSLIIPARKGLFLADVFEIADALLLDQDDLVQKGYGWLLKAAADAHQPEVFDFVMARKEQMPRTALRYAIEKMPPELRQRAMAR